MFHIRDVACPVAGARRAQYSQRYTKNSPETLLIMQINFSAQSNMQHRAEQPRRRWMRAVDLELCSKCSWIKARDFVHRLWDVLPIPEGPGF